MNNFIECSTIEDANKVDLDYYTFMERVSAEKGLYCFKIREARRK